MMDEAERDNKREEEGVQWCIQIKCPLVLTGSLTWYRCKGCVFDLCSRIDFAYGTIVYNFYFSFKVR